MVKLSLQQILLCEKVLISFSDTKMNGALAYKITTILECFTPHVQEFEKFSKDIVTSAKQAGDKSVQASLIQNKYNAIIECDITKLTKDEIASIELTPKEIRMLKPIIE